MEVPLISHFELMTVNPKYLATSSLFKFSIPLAVPTESIFLFIHENFFCIMCNWPRYSNWL